MIAAALISFPLRAGYDHYGHPATWAFVAAFAAAGGVLLRNVWVWTAAEVSRTADEPPQMGWGEWVLAWAALVFLILYTTGVLPQRPR